MKAAIALTVLLLAVGAACAADTPGSNPSVPQATVQDRMASARKAVDRKDWSTAQRELTVVVREAPRNADAHNLLGYTYRKRASPDMAKAYEHYDLALKIDPAHKGAREYLGEAYLVDRRLTDAEQQLVELEKICGGPACEEYRDLAKSIAEYKAKL
jgi:Tfp pilus assembly protein PilF